MGCGFCAPHERATMKANPKGLSRSYLAMFQKLKFDVTQRKTLARAIDKSEHHYEQLLKESYRMQEQLRHLSHLILFAHEEERRKISRELHDEIGQILAGVNIRLAALKNEPSDHTKNIYKKKISSTQRLVEKSMKTIHRFAHELLPPVLDDIGLVPALQSHVRDFTKRTRIPVHFKVCTFAKINELCSIQRTAFYRVVQEALSNVARHAGASLVGINLQRRDGAVHMEIQDNGRSFSIERMLHTGRRKRLGLLGMRERMKMIGGDFSVESKPGKGTTIRVQAPLKIPIKIACAHRVTGSQIVV